MLNTVSLIGRLGADPEAKFFESGSCVVKVSLAVDRVKNGKKEVSWIPLEVWGKVGEALAENCRKGSKIGVSGELIAESYRKGTENRKSVFVKVNSVEYCSSKGSSDPEEDLAEQF